MTLRWPWLLGLIVGSAALALAFVVGSNLIEQWGLAARWTARVGFPLLIAAYVARPLVQLWPSNFAKGLLKRRKWIGLGFATSHTIHLYALIMALTVAGQTIDLFTLVGGGGAYVILYIMAFTSNQASMRALGVWWKRIHWIGIHWLWGVFAFSYLGRILDPERMAIGLLFFPVAMGAALIRFLAWQKSRRRRSAPQPA